MSTDGLIMEGKTVEEAVNKALSKLELQRKDVEIRILQEPRAGLVLGIGSRPARVEVRKKPGKEEDLIIQLLANAGNNGGTDSHADADSENGTISIKDGQVFINRPHGSGRYPIIKPGPNVTVNINGKEIKTERVVFATDVVEIKPENEVPESSVDVEVSDDGMEAYVTINRKHGAIYKIVDSEPVSKLIVKAAEVESIPADEISVEDVEQALAEHGVVYGINQQQIEAAVRGDPGRRLLVARGKPKKDGEDGRIEYHFRQKRERIVDLEAPQIDYKELFRIPTVVKGEVLASKIPPQEGTPGRTVYGEVIPPKPVEEARLSAGDGAQLTDDKQQVVATRSGRPAITHTSIINVLPTYTVTGDADLEIGNITFDGDVVVYGSVKNGIRIKSGGKCYVGGFVEKSVIESGDDIIVTGSIISSSITAGGLSTFYLNIIRILKQVKSKLEEMVAAIRAVKSHPRFARLSTDIQDGRLLKLLMEMKFPNLAELLMEFHDELTEAEKNYEVREELYDIFALINSNFMGRGPLNIQKADAVIDVVQGIDHVIEILNANIAEGADIYARYAQNASLKGSGRIVLSGTACYNSSLVARHGIDFRNGSFRGGKMIVHKGNVLVKELGSPNGVNTSVEIVEDGNIKARRAYVGVSLQISGQSFKIIEQMEHVHAFLDNQKKLRVESGNPGKTRSLP